MTKMTKVPLGISIKGLFALGARLHFVLSTMAESSGLTFPLPARRSLTSSSAVYIVQTTFPAKPRKGSKRRAFTKIICRNLPDSQTMR